MADAYHNEETLKTEGITALLGSCSDLSPFPVCHGCEWIGETEQYRYISIILP